MIDLHCHILPGVDDGAADTAEALAMARQAQNDGIDVICATPHIRSDHDVAIEEIHERVYALNTALHDAAIAVRVSAAGEVAAPALPELDERQLAAVALSHRWILLEPPAGALDGRLVAAVEHLGARGYRAVIAHPERHPGAAMEEVLARCVEARALVQATAALLESGPASPKLIDLARRGLVHVLGSDSHSAQVGRPVRLSGAVRRLAAEADLRPHLDWMAEIAPAAILSGDDVEPPIER